MLLQAQNRLKEVHGGAGCFGGLFKICSMNRFLSLEGIIQNSHWVFVPTVKCMVWSNIWINYWVVLSTDLQYSIWDSPLFWIRCFHMLERRSGTLPRLGWTKTSKRCTSQMALVQSIGTAYNFFLKNNNPYLGGGNSNIFYFHPGSLGKWSNLTIYIYIIFFKWVETNHQLDILRAL